MKVDCHGASEKTGESCTWEFLRAGGGGPGLVKLSAEPCLVVPFVGGGGGRDCEGTLGGGGIHHTLIGCIIFSHS